MGKRKQLINGKAYDFSSITIDVDGCKGIEPVGIDYGDSQEVELIHKKNGGIRGYGVGNLDGDGKLTLLREDFNTLMDQYKGGFYKILIPKITVSYAEEGATTVTDTLTKIKFTERKISTKQNDKSVQIELPFKILGGVKFDGKKALS